MSITTKKRFFLLTGLQFLKYKIIVLFCDTFFDMQ